MARIQGVQRDQAGPMVRLVYWFMRKGMTKMTGREPAYGSGIEPVEIWAYQPKMMSGMGKFQQAVRKGHTSTSGSRTWSSVLRLQVLGTGRGVGDELGGSPR